MIRRTIKTVTEEFDEQGRLRWRTTDDIVEEDNMADENDFAELKEETIEIPVYCTFEQDCAADHAHYSSMLSSGNDDYKCDSCETSCCVCDAEDIAVHIYVHADGAVTNG